MRRTVIGAGLGGLTAGALLAKTGDDVRVLEAHDKPGGCATTFKRFDLEIEVSLHEIEGLDRHDMKRSVFEALGVFDAVEFERSNAFYRYVDPERGLDFVVPHGTEDFVEGFAEVFPEEENGVRSFVELVTRVREEMYDWPFLDDPSLSDYALAPLRQRTFGRYRNATLGDVLDELIGDEACKLALAANLGYYHDDPYELAFPYFATAQGGYIEGGGYYIRGGSQRLSDHLAKIIEEEGGTVECERLVTDVEVEDGRATGVVHDKPRTGGDERTTGADTVVANAAIPNVADELLPEPYGSELKGEIRDFEVAPSLSTLYVVFEPTPSELGNEHYSTKIAGKGVGSLEGLADSMRGSYGSRPVSFVDYGQLDAGLAPEGMSVGVVSTVDHYNAWTGLTDKEYRRKKERVTEVLLRRLGNVIPGIEEAVEHRELATPRTIERFTRNPQGTAYGFAQTPDQSLGDRAVDSPLPNLRFASAWSSPGGGFTGAVLGGTRTAGSLSEDVKRFIRR